MSAMAVYGGLAAVLIGLYPKHRWLVIAASAVVIVNVGLSRVYLGVHWPLDVIAGWAAGVLFVVATVHIVHRLVARTKAMKAAP
jgi:undecaprenyl-diphosphatase